MRMQVVETMDEGSFKNCPKSLMLKFKYIEFRQSLVVVKDVGSGVKGVFYDQWIFFYLEHSLHAVSVMCERIVRWFWFEWEEFIDQDHVTVIHWGYRTLHMCQIYLSIPAPKLNETECNVGCLLFISIASNI